MKKGIWILLLLCVALEPVRAQDKVGTTAAPFLGLGVGARATAMGSAQVAVASGPTALYWNPAAISHMPTSGVEFFNSNWLVDSRLQYVGAVLNLGNAGHVGLSMTSLNYGQMEVTTETSPEGTGELFTPMDLAGGVTYSRALTDRFAIGGTLKFVRQTIWHESANGMAVDLGVVYQTPLQNIRIGMIMANFGSNMKMEGKDLRKALDTEPNMEGNNPRLPAHLETNAWAMPLVFRVGLAMDAVTTSSQRLTVTTDFSAPSDNAQNASFGTEYAWRNMFFVRGGYRQAFTKIETDGGWTGGLGLRYALNERLAGYFDYTYQQYGDIGNPQMFSVGVTF